ncbi:MAG: hypothetical protein ING59_02090 [Burkholderiales bacterium]|nr:hypothetical protein [Burkholderiales bacterium]
MTPEEYKTLFAEPTPGWKKDELKESETRAGRALAFATDIRKFEIELYWKRATYFWAFIGAAFAGYALTYKTSADHEPWLSLLFSALGLIFSFAWYLVNRGSKFWQNNWERHVDMLEDMTLGPLYKIIASDISTKNPLIAPGSFSVTKINQVLSVFVTFIWCTLFTKSLLPISPDREFDFGKIAIAVATITCLVVLFSLCRSSNEQTLTKLSPRALHTETY